MSNKSAENLVWRQRILMAMVGAAAFGLLALLSLMFAREAGRVAAIWPANGALLALVLLRPRSERGWLIGGALTANVVVTLAMGDAPGVAVGLSIANALEIGIVAWAMRGLDARRGVLELKAMLRFVLSGGLVGPMVSAGVAAVTLAFWPGQPFWPNLLRWLTADALGMLIVTPPLLLMAHRGAWDGRSSSMSRMGMAALLAGVLALVFLQTSYPLLFLIPPVLILIAFRCGAGPAAAGLLISAAVSLAAVAVGTGPLALVDEGLDQRALIQQVFLATLVFTTLPIVAVLKSRAESEARYRLLAETSTDVVARFDAQGRFLYVSPSAKGILGRDPDSMLGKDCTGMIPEDDLRAIRRTLRDYVAAGPDAPSPRYEYQAIRADGSPIWLEATPRAIRDETGQVIEFHDCVRDITERKTADRAQQELLDTLKLAENLAGLGSWKLDVLTGQVRWSEQVYAIHGVDPDTFDPGLDDAVGFYHPDDQQAVRDWCARAIETGQAEDMRLRLIRADGEERIVISQCRPERQDGKTTALFGVFQDVTERLRAEEQLAASEARYRLMADRASDIIVTYGTDGLIRYISPSVEASTGLAPESLIGRPVTSLIHADDIPALTDAFRDLVRTNGASARDGVRYRGATPDGTVRWFEARTTLIRDDAGRVVEFHDAVRDISATKALEDELIAARDTAEKAAQIKSEFLANMSHELRTPLTSVIGFSGLLKMSAALPEAERRYADRIGTASEALLSVINDILDYSKLEADAVGLDPQPFDPVALARGAAAIVEGQCQAKGLELVIEIENDLPALVVGDEGRLRQVMLNFLSNAAKFTISGHVRLDVASKGDRLRVAVTDSGIGISAEKIEALFERFTQADASTTRVYGGTGLGLAISRRLIEMMGGEIGATSRAGEGSTFWFEVPLNEAEAGAGQAKVAEQSLRPGLRVLMADDAAANRELVKILLAGWDVKLTTAADGAEAVQAASHAFYDLILMDVHMPVMDGLHATRAIRALPGRKGSVPILALTANVQPEQVEACRQAGMNDHVGKPIQIAELVQAMTKALRPKTRPTRKAAA